MALAAGGLFLYSFSVQSKGCGILWTPPKNHFDGVNEHGILSYWESIGNVDLGDGLNVPLVIGFNGARKTSSPYLGAGWVLAILESNVVQIDNRHFVVMEPDGLNLRFKRKDEASPTLTGQSGWMAQVSGNTFTAWAQCGWKIVFVDGKISSITTPKNHQITYNYVNGVINEVDVDQSPIIVVQFDSKGHVSGLVCNGKGIGISESDRPEVETINGQKVVGRIDPSLAQITRMDGKTENYKFAVNQKLLPTLVISGVNTRSFTWDSDTGVPITDGGWSYQVVPGTGPFANASITRTNQAGQTEMWFDNKEAGQETTLDLDGLKTITERFTSGILRDKIRKIMTVKNGISETTYEATYNEKGVLVRELTNGATILHDDNGNIIEVIKDGKVDWSANYDPNGKLLSAAFSQSK